MTPVLDLDKMERVAWAATPGPWALGADLVGVILNSGDVKSDITRNGWAKTVCKITHASWAGVGDHVANGTHIAAFNPKVVLALIARIRAAEARERDAWIAGRDAAAGCADAQVVEDRLAEAHGHATKEEAWLCVQTSKDIAKDIAKAIRALTPPQEGETDG